MVPLNRALTSRPQGDYRVRWRRGPSGDCDDDAAFDVIFVDWRHPDSNENPLLAAIREWAPRSAVVLMTSSHTDVVTEAYRFGVHQLLCKPFDIDDVQNIVAAASMHRLEHER